MTEKNAFRVTMFRRKGGKRAEGKRVMRERTVYQCVRVSFSTSDTTVSCEGLTSTTVSRTSLLWWRVRCPGEEEEEEEEELSFQHSFSLHQLLQADGIKRSGQTMGHLAPRRPAGPRPDPMARPCRGLLDCIQESLRGNSYMSTQRENPPERRHENTLQ